MKRSCHCVVRTHMDETLERACQTGRMTPSPKLAERISGRKLCCMSTFILYLNYCCRDPLSTIRECRDAIEQEDEHIFIP